MARRGLSRAEILDAALGLADEQGLAAVSMRAVAQRLGVTPMALYRHVGDKDGLLDALVERLLNNLNGVDDRGERDAAGGRAERDDAGARAGHNDREGPDGGSAEVATIDVLAARAAALRATARRHPEAFTLLLSRRAVTPAALQSRDQVYSALTSAGVPAAEVPRLERVLSTFVIGFAASEASGRFADQARADADFRYAQQLLGQVIQLAAGRPPVSPAG